jgi:hypothetical protein
MTTKAGSMLLLSLLFAATVQFCWAGVGSHDTMYVGGTVDIKQGTEGKSFTNDEKTFLFEYTIKTDKERWSQPGTWTFTESLAIPYERMDSLEYGQKVGRRIGLAVMVNPLFLLSKKRKHFLTIGYTDQNDKQQTVVLELGKDVVRATLATLEARSGRKIEYQDEEARNSGRN